mmetsp:Transcript_66189/g.158148  ORF Transcript_66189/g.158148 Transcript_66189/m.158148 type:complete len:251 (-) Transcript_66189:399-1151(-)
MGGCSSPAPGVPLSPPAPACIAFDMNPDMRATWQKALGYITSEASEPSFMLELSSSALVKRRPTATSSMLSSPTSDCTMALNSCTSSTPSELVSCCVNTASSASSSFSDARSHSSTSRVSHSLRRSAPPPSRARRMISSWRSEGYAPEPYFDHACCVASIAITVSMSGFFFASWSMFSLICDTVKTSPRTHSKKLHRSWCQYGCSMMPAMSPKTRSRRPPSVFGLIARSPRISACMLDMAMLLRPNRLMR